MLQLDVVVNVNRLLLKVKQQLPNDIAYLRALTLSRTAFAIRDRIKDELPRAFDAPTPYTLRGVFTKQATKTDPEARVFIPHSQDMQGRSAREYMRPGTQGSLARRQKKTEFLLTKAGFLPPGWVSKPARTAAAAGLIDKYGNLKPRIYAQILNVLQLKKLVDPRAANVSMRSQKRAARMRVDSEWFAVRPGEKQTAGKWLPAGVYRRMGRRGEKLQAVLYFIPRAKYRQQMDLQKVAQDEVDRALPAVWNRAFNEVMANRKGR